MLCAGALLCASVALLCASMTLLRASVALLCASVALDPGHRVYVASANVGGVGAMGKNNTMSTF